MGQHVRVLIPEEDIEKKICEVAAKISEDYQGKQLHLICILKGGAMFMCELAKRIKGVDVSFDFMSVSSYGAGTTSSGIVKIVKDLDEPLEGKNVDRRGYHRYRTYAQSPFEASHGQRTEIHRDLYAS
jgi:hypoxanthine phosphoribosyltransferase